ncbi:ankyrin repeat-containing protein [Anaeramoeba flamelloides]|uniref:Ankyrin repeat-containing protein n=1 Tax=Anaeramoeba flamelloides TaxID=1746091 RepID=A0ABQ8ZEB7_9EUKA|nr:ankyrin repeat-containing protein [Anaeramoeba flamelloides]
MLRTIVIQILESPNIDRVKSYFTKNLINKVGVEYFMNKRLELKGIHIVCLRNPVADEIIDHLVAIGCKLDDQVTALQYTPLHFAIFNPKSTPKLIEKLVSHKANPNLKDSKGNSPLSVLIKLNRYDLLDALLASPKIDANTKNNFGLAPLHHLAYSYSIPENVIGKLVKHGGNINTTNEEGRTPLHIFCMKDSVNVVTLREFVDNCANLDLLDNDHNVPLHLLCMNSAALFQVFNVIYQATNTNAKLLNSNKDTPLHCVAKRNKNRNKIIKSLINPEHVNLLNRDNMSPLLLYLKNGSTNTEILELFLQNGSNPNAADKNGNTPLHLIGMKKKFSKENVSLLIKYGSDVQLKNYFNGLNKKLKNSFEKYKIEKYVKSAKHSFLHDFQKLFENGDFTDCSFKGIKAHKFILELRTRQKISKIDQVFEGYTDQEILKFIRWIYFEQIDDLGLIEEICEKFGIEKQENESLKFEIQKLYQDQESKNFTIYVQEKPIKVHKFILQARSELFKGLFLNCQEGIKSIEDYSNFSFKTISILIKFFYQDLIDDYSIDDDTIDELRMCKDYFQLNSDTPLTTILDNLFGKKYLADSCVSIRGLRQGMEKTIENKFSKFKDFVITYNKANTRQPFYVVQFPKEEDADRAIKTVNFSMYNSTIQRHNINTTLYCSYFDMNINFHTHKKLLICLTHAPKEEEEQKREAELLNGMSITNWNVDNVN